MIWGISILGNLHMRILGDLGVLLLNKMDGFLEDCSTMGDLLQWDRILTAKQWDTYMIIYVCYIRL